MNEPVAESTTIPAAGVTVKAPPVSPVIVGICAVVSSTQYDPAL